MKNINKPPYIIAEIGANHNGSISRARKLIINAKKASCDAVKFQSWDENLNSSKEYEKNPLMLKQYLKYKLSFRDLSKLSKFAKKKNIEFGTAVFNEKQLNEALKINCDFIKIASMDANNYPFLKKVLKIKKNLIISTGFTNHSELQKLKSLIIKSKKKNITILHCISLYPPKKYSLINLNNIVGLKKQFKLNSGFSDHTVRTEVLYAAAALGAKVIEKHFTINKKDKGWDHAISADLKEMKNIVKKCKFISSTLGSYKKKITPEELKKSKIMRRSIAIIKNIKKGEKFTKLNLDLRRPGSGMPPIKIFKIYGKKAKKNLNSGEMLKPTDIY